MLKLLRTSHRSTCQPLVKHLVYEVGEQTVLVLYVLLYDELTIEDLFCCASAWSKTCLPVSPLPE